MASKKKSQHLETPQKNRIIGAVAMLERKGVKYTKKDLMDTFSVSRGQVDYALQHSTSERTKKRSELKKRNAEKLSERDLIRVEKFLAEKGAEEQQATNWVELVRDFGFDVHPHTLRDRIAERSSSARVVDEKS